MKNSTLVSDVLDLVTFIVVTLILSILFSGVIFIAATIILGYKAFKNYSAFLEETNQIIIDPISEVKETAKKAIFKAEVKVELIANNIKGKALNVKDHVCYYSNKTKQRIQAIKSPMKQLKFSFYTFLIIKTQFN